MARGRDEARRLGSLAAMMLAATPLLAQQTVELPGRDRGLDADLVDVYTVGTFDGADWETFGEIRQVGFDAAGNLYVLDTQASRMVVVDRAGDFVRMFGTQGEGPGEWREPAGAAVMRDGRVVVADAGHRAYQIFDTNGEFVGSARLGDGPVVMIGTIHPDPRGNAVFNGGGPTRISVEADGLSGPPSLPRGRPIRRVELQDGAAEQVFYDAWAPPRPEPRNMGGGGGIIVSMGGPRVFEPRLHAAALPDGGMAVVDSSAWAVKIVGPDGDVRSRLTRPIEPREVTSRIERAEMQRQLDALESGAGPRMRIVTDDGSGAREMPEEQVREMMRERIENTGFYPEIPVIQQLAAGWGGTLWVERSEVDPTEDGPVDLVSPGGEYLGTLDADGPGVPSAFGPDGLVAYIERNDMDVPVVVVRRLPAELR